MAPSRGKGRTTVRPSRRRAARRTPSDNGLPDVYADMLREAQTDDDHEDSRPLKKRRVTPAKSTQSFSSPRQQMPKSSSPTALQSGSLGTAGVQTIEDSSESDSSELDFEDVDINDTSNLRSSSHGPIEDLTISVKTEGDTHHTAHRRRKPVTTIEKSHRLIVHKLHVLCLLAHCMYVNGRCNNLLAQNHLRPLLSSKTISYLNPSRQHTQFQRNRSFMDGLEQAVNAFVADFKITRSGMSKPHWNLDDGPSYTSETLKDPMDSADFVKAARDLEASQDSANQLFCALLRAVGVDARIVCSIQALPFANPPKAVTPKKPAKARMMAIAPELSLSQLRSFEHDRAVSSSSAIGRVPSARKRLGQTGFVPARTQSTAARQKPAAVDKLSYPVFWVEAFNEATQKWIAVDPIVTHTIGQPTKLEPPASYGRNQLTYAVAFESDGSARDVTRRYAKAYNAKTRRARIEASTDGTDWWKRSMRCFRKLNGPLDRDQVEDSELSQKEAREGLPANVLDFKDHPYYALERHLRRNEVIHPKREVGRVNAGTAAKQKMELVFRRRDVLSCKSADKWYRCGREIKPGEQPLKHVPARKGRRTSPDPEATSEDTARTTALYAPFQTRLYVPPPVQHGRVPKNAYGNLDIYVPSMVPAGGSHIRHSSAQQAARLIRVDYADAVTGFNFKGRHGTAVIEGAVVAEEYAEAVHAVIESIEYEMLEDASRQRSLTALRLWKRFMTGLRIAERVRAYGDRSTADDAESERSLEVRADATVDRDLVTAGRYSLTELEKPRKSARKRRKTDSDSDGASDTHRETSAGEEQGENEEGSLHDPAGAMSGGFFSEKDNADTSIFDTHSDHVGPFTRDDAESDQGGGFLVEATDSNADSGGFLVGTRDSDQERADVEASLPSSEAQEEQLLEQSHDIAGRDPDATSTAESPERNNLVEHEASGDVAEQESETSGVSRARLPMESVESPKESLSGSSNDRGSMLSHDPEDDELEPDWLESD